MENENKILSLLETLVNEQQKTANRLDNLESKFDNIESRFDNIEQEVQTVKAISLRIENDHGKHLKNLYDSHVSNLNKHQEYEPRITKLEDTVAHHSLEILALKHK